MSLFAQHERCPFPAGGRAAGCAVFWIVCVTVLVAYRIADGRRPIFDATGAMLRGWALEFGWAAGDCVMRIEIPDGVLIETVRPDEIAGWDAEDWTVGRGFGDRWLREMRSAVLKVPSVVTGGRECNLLINPAHAQFGRIVAGEAEGIR